MDHVFKVPRKCEVPRHSVLIFFGGCSCLPIALPVINYIVLPFLLVCYSSLAHMNISYICLNMDVMSQPLGHDGGASISEKITTFGCC